MAEGFSSAREMLGWVGEGLSEFQAAVQAFSTNGDSYSLVQDFNEDGTEITLKVRIPALPNNLRKLATHAIWDIKHALDHATHAAVSLIVGGDPGDIHFPVASHPNDLRAKLYGPKSKFPPELRDTFNGFECYPTGHGYPSGNDLVVVFNGLANTSKHAVALSAVASNYVNRVSWVGKVGGGKLFPNGWGFSDNELTIGTLPFDPDMKADIQLSVFVALDEAGLSRADRADVLIAMYGGHAQRFIDKLETDVAAILAARP